jgi:hypothetical protein
MKRLPEIKAVKGAITIPPRSGRPTGRGQQAVGRIAMRDADREWRHSIRVRVNDAHSMAQGNFRLLCRAGSDERAKKSHPNVVTNLCCICTNEAVSVKLKSPSTTSDSLADARTRDIHVERKASRSGGCLTLLICDRLLTGGWRDRNLADKLAKPSKIKVFMRRKSSATGLNKVV